MVFVFRRMTRIVGSLWRRKGGDRERVSHEFAKVGDGVVGVARRKYRGYEEYLQHQSEKLGLHRGQIAAGDREYESVVADRYNGLVEWKAKSVICLGARLGGEVRAFKSLGALAVGVDLEPGPGNLHVLTGDFHEIAFPDSCFDFAFSNAVDHVYDLDRFGQEVARVLKPSGTLFLELAEVHPGAYEAIDTSDPEPVVRRIQKYFDLISVEPITNATRYANWSGQLFALKKKS